MLFFFLFPLEHVSCDGLVVVLAAAVVALMVVVVVVVRVVVADVGQRVTSRGW